MGLYSCIEMPKFQKEKRPKVTIVAVPFQVCVRRKKWYSTDKDGASFTL